LDIRFHIVAGKPVQLSKKQEYYTTIQGTKYHEMCKDYPTMKTIEMHANKLRSVSKEEAAKIESELTESENDLGQGSQKLRNVNLCTQYF
jgi:hypothetical protein